MQCLWHPYRYYPYEKDFSVRELKALFPAELVVESANGLIVHGSTDVSLAQRLVYCSNIITARGDTYKTQQMMLESGGARIGAKRQSTRYSAHGLHEYKGRFNPQVAKFLLNIFGAKKNTLVLDPFCGSGTSLVESSHLGIKAVGLDINPLATFLANAKLSSLGISSETILKQGLDCLKSAKCSKAKFKFTDERGVYLQSWFPRQHLDDIERLRLAIEASEEKCKSVLLAIASNLLRDYSLQEPADLRIRRRISPFPSISFFAAYETALSTFCDRLFLSQKVLGVRKSRSKAINVDCKQAVESKKLNSGSFDLVLTSPPYATALPYIDTQRLSLVWLHLIPPNEILSLESELVGSREFRGKDKRELLNLLMLNEANLPESEFQYCMRLQNALTEKDGFRRQVVPTLLYRYFNEMSKAFVSVRRLVKTDVPFGLIVGGNHTVLSGNRFDINTPEHLANIASECGWVCEEIVPLQTYRRYGLHVNNATSTEALVILKAV